MPRKEALMMLVMFKVSWIDDSFQRHSVFIYWFLDEILLIERVRDKSPSSDSETETSLTGHNGMHLHDLGCTAAEID